MNFNINFDFGKTVNKLDRMIDLGKNNTKILQDIDKSVLEPNFIRHINDSRNPNGSSYAELKNKKEAWRKPLIARGQYRAGFFGKVSNGNVEIRNNFYYAKYHENKTAPRTRLPMRSAVYIDNGMRNDIKSIIMRAYKNA